MAASFRFLLLLVLAGAAAHAATPLDDASGLYHTKKYPAAEAALERIVQADPQNAAACHLLGLTLEHRGDPGALEAALPWAEKAMNLDPTNSIYVGDYGGICFELADKHRSFSYATRGSSAMEKAVRLDPNNLDARDGLMQFYARAPWPLGSQTRARTEADEIARRDPKRALRTFLRLGVSFEKAGDREAARGAYAAALQINASSPEAAAGLTRVGRAPPAP